MLVPQFESSRFVSPHIDSGGSRGIPIRFDVLFSHLGDLAGIREGAQFNTFSELHKAGVHRQTVKGIVGGESEGAESIVLNGGYEDDKDFGDEIIAKRAKLDEDNFWLLAVQKIELGLATCGWEDQTAGLICFRLPCLQTSHKSSS